MENLNDKNLKRAKAKVEEIKNFYNHIFIYIAVNLFITFVWKFSFTIFGNFIVSNQFNEDGFTHIPIWFIWGIFLALDALKTFGFLNFFGKDWEERKIDEFMNEKK